MENGSKDVWKNVYKDGGRLLYPNERACAFLAQYFGKINENGNKNAIDIGFGGGRHLKLLLDYGFSVYGVDCLENVVNSANERFSGYPNFKKCMVSDVLDFEMKEYFDAIIAFGLVFMCEKEEMKKNLKSIAKNLSYEGVALVDFRTKDDWLYKKGVQIDENTYCLGAEVGVYEGSYYGFYDIEEIEVITKECGLELIKKERTDFWKNDLKERHSWWVTHLKKSN